MAARLRVVILCLLVTPSLQGNPNNNHHGVRKDKSSDLVGKFGTYLTNELGNTAIGTSHFEVRAFYSGTVWLELGLYDLMVRIGGERAVQTF